MMVKGKDSIRGAYGYEDDNGQEVHIFFAYNYVNGKGALQVNETGEPVLFDIATPIRESLKKAGYGGTQLNDIVETFNATVIEPMRGVK